MRELFSLEDIFNVMIELETIGNMHYNKMKDLTKNSKLKILFGQLAKAELAHKDLYLKFKTEIINFRTEKVTPEYKDYIDALLKQTIQFLDESKDISEFDKGFKVAIQLEKDTILFLKEIRSIIDTKHHDSIDKIIMQEQDHLKSLYKFMTTL